MSPKLRHNIFLGKNNFWGHRQKNIREADKTDRQSKHRQTTKGQKVAFVYNITSKKSN